MSDDVTIPADVAKSLALFLREPSTVISTKDGLAWADLLDPKPPTLREQVVAVQREAWYSDTSTPEATADAVLAVVADWLAAQPLRGSSNSHLDQPQRDHDVRLLRGESRG